MLNSTQYQQWYNAPSINDLPYTNGKPSLKIGSWNVRGWGKGVNNELCKDILFALDLDILCVCETHLTGNENIIIEGYNWIGNNRYLIGLERVLVE